MSHIGATGDRHEAMKGHQLCNGRHETSRASGDRGARRGVVHERRRAKVGGSKERYEVRTEYERRPLERVGDAFNHIDSDDIGRTLGVISMRALGIRSSYKGRTVDA